jgi:hypothetical protein
MSWRWRCEACGWSDLEPYQAIDHTMPAPQGYPWVYPGCPECGAEVCETMLTTRYPVNFPYTRAELEALLAYARAHDVEQGGRYDARSAAINVWSHAWVNRATWEESGTIGTFYVRWGETPALWQIECDEGFSLEDLMEELGRLELSALGSVKHGHVPRRPLL